MPKRILDGERLWTSSKLKQVKIQFRAEYANLHPLAEANGSFECDPEQIHVKVYAYNRPDVTPKMVVQILDEFERVGMLHRWEERGKTWGYWNGIEKPGLLPSKSAKLRRDYHIEAPDLPHGVPMGETRDHTSGLGVGFGIGRVGVRVQQKSGTTKQLLKQLPTIFKNKFKIGLGKIYVEKELRSLVEEHGANNVIAAFELWCEHNPNPPSKPASEFVRVAESYLTEDAVAVEAPDLDNLCEKLYAVAQQAFTGNNRRGLIPLLAKHSPDEILKAYREFADSKDAFSVKFAPKDFIDGGATAVIAAIRTRVEEDKALAELVEKNIEILQKQDVPAEEEPNDPMFDVVE